MGSRQFYKRVKGPMDNYEDWYYLKQGDDGALVVEHVWSYVSPSLSQDHGREEYSITDFMSKKGADTGAKIALKNLLKEERGSD